jgi:hypothetical protein
MNDGSGRRDIGRHKEPDGRRDMEDLLPNFVRLSEKKRKAV